jgi:class 3 adenylate cyclase/tetratricopeptide (TPR) repeat protein
VKVTRSPDASTSGEIASAYVSPLILRALTERPAATVPWIEKVSGTLLMADISGFTRMSERLAESGREGAELLTGIINRYFTAMIDAARANGGHNLKFGGDALLLFFDGPGHAERAARTALDMQRENKKQAGLRIGRERHKPSVSIGIHSGEFWSAAVGDPETRLQHVIFGEDVNRVVAAEAEANAGEVAATPEVVGEGWVTTERGEFRLIEAVGGAGSNRVPFEADTSPAGASTEAYLPPPVLWALRGKGSVSAGEHRGVVVMFIHATGFEDLANRNGAEQALMALQEYTSKLVHLLVQYGGFLVSNDIYTEGVKFIVAFGAPIAREDDSANALRVALALDEWLGEAGLELQHRIGINSGNAFAGDIGAPYRREYTVMGDCVNLAARLMSAALPGQVLVSAETGERAGAGFVLRELPAIRVKGKSDEIAIRELGGLDSGAEATAVDQRSPFVGRTRELERLREICLGVESGKSQALVLMGEAGAGKSRLLLETAQYASARGWRVLQARCHAHASGTPFAPWVPVLRSLLEMEAGEAAEDRGRALKEGLERLAPQHLSLAPLLNQVLDANFPANDVVNAMDEETRGQRLMELLSAIVTGAGAETSLLIVIDDAHHSDETSLDLARRVQGDARSRLLLALAQRSPGRRIFSARSGATTMEIGPLGDEEAGRLATLALGRGAARPAVLITLLSKARGNPLFIEEVARTIREAGAVGQLDEDAADIEQALEGLVPDRLQNLMMSRIDRLEPSLRDVVKAAAVVGSEIDEALVTTGLRTMGIDSGAGPALRRLVSEGVLEAAGAPGAYNFTHAMIQEVAYGNLSFNLRRGIHGGVARELESSRGDLSPLFEILAHHFERAADRPKTLEYSAKSGDKARAVFANDDAIRHYKRAAALTAVVAIPEREAAGIAVSLGDVYELTGRHRPAKESYVQALGACIGRHLRRNADPAGIEFGEAAAGRAASMRSLAADICRKLGYVCERQSDYGPALAWFEGSLAALPRGDASGRGASLMGVAGVLYRAGKFDEAQEWAAKGLRTLRAAGPSLELARALNVLGLIYRDQGLVRKAIKHRLEALAMFEGLGDVMGQGDMLNNLGLDYFSGGEWPNASQRFRECLEIAERIGDTELVAIVHNNLGEVYLAQGDLATAKREFRAARETAAQIGNGALTGLAETNLGELLTIEGDLPEAREMLRRSIRSLRKLGAQSLAMEGEVRLAELHLAARDYYAAETLANKLVAASRKAEVRPIEGRALRLLGELAARRGRAREAEALFGASIRLFAGTGAAHGEAKTRLALGRALGRPTETRKALRMFRAVGAEGDVVEAERVLANPRPAS